MLNLFQHLIVIAHQAKKQPQNVIFCDDGDGLLIYKRACKRSLEMLQTKCPTQRLKALLVKAWQSPECRVSLRALKGRGNLLKLPCRRPKKTLDKNYGGVKWKHHPTSERTRQWIRKTESKK